MDRRRPLPRVDAKIGALVDRLHSTQTANRSPERSDALHEQKRAAAAAAAARKMLLDTRTDGDPVGLWRQYAERPISARMYRELVAAAHACNAGIAVEPFKYDA